MALLTQHRVLMVAISGLGACYSPELTDCTVKCSSSDDCSADQLCVAGGFCAASGVDCREDPGPGPQPPAVQVTLRVEVDGEGKVVIANVGTCMNDESGGDSNDLVPNVEMCEWIVAQGTEIQLHAMMLWDKPFDKWERDCMGQAATCTLTATDMIHAKAKF
jgi:hypothetical protein